MIERGTCPSQRTVSARLHELAGRVEAEGLGAPALIVALSSSGTVRRFVEALGPDTGRAAAIATGAGTAQVALSLGLSVHVIPGKQSIDGLVSGIVDCAAVHSKPRAALSADPVRITGYTS